MTPERYRQIGELYHAALEVASAERPAFLTRECAGDEDLRHEVESLINSHQQSEDFIAKPALSVAAEMLAARAPESITGQMIGRYRVLSLVAEGGMGRVFLAEDTTLNRRVALKLLPEYFTNDKNQLQRFHQEARATSALNHPNILTVYEVGHWHGSDFIATEFVEGVTLRKRMRRKLSVAAAVDIAQQVASALSAAHAAGIVHRDIKPENIMIRPDGLVRILDFGIAKYAEPKRTRDSKDSWVKTATGVIVGTTAYMSPEQARGEVIDGRTDIWSLGVILYEMIAHRLPFRGKTPTDRVAAILEREPEPLNKIRRGIPHELEAIIKRALAKDKENRYTRAADLAEDLRELRRAVGEERTFRFGLPLPARGMMSSRKRRSVSVGANPYVPLRRRAYLFAVFAVVLFVGAIALSYYSYTQKNTTVGDKKSIAVLPLKPINTTDRDELYEIGIADSLIHRLSSIKGFVVRPLSATRKYADIEQDPIAAGREQQVDYILASNYQLVGGKIRVTSQLYNVASGQVEETYKSEKDAGNIFAMQDAVAGEVGDLLLARFETSSSSPIAKRGTSNEEAYRLYLQGMFLVDKENLADNKRAIELFDEALAIDPNYAKAWAGKARALCYFAHWGGSSPDAQFAKAKPAIERALALDANLPEAYGVLGIIKADYDWNFAESERQFLRAIEIAPDSDNVYRWYGMRLAGKGRSEEAISRIKTAIDLNPNSLSHQIVYGRILYFARRYDDAITQLQRVIEMDSARPVAYSLLWRSYHQKGDYSRAYESFMKLQQLIGTKAEVLKDYETSYAKSGWQGALLRYIEIVKANDTKGSAAYTISVLSALLGQRDQPFLYLNDAVKNRSLEISNIFGDPSLDSLRGDPRYDELVRRVESK